MTSLVIKYLYLLLIGSFAGLIAGGLGTSTAYALVLGLVFSGVSKDYKHAAALTLFTILPPISIGAVYTYYKEKMIDIPAGLFLMVVCFITALLGARFNKYFSNAHTEIGIGIYLLIVSIYMFYRGISGLS